MNYSYTRTKLTKRITDLQNTIFFQEVGALKFLTFESLCQYKYKKNSCFSDFWTMVVSLRATSLDP